MFTLVRKQIRPNIEVEFFNASKCSAVTLEVKDYLDNQYKRTGKMISSDTVFTENGLESITTIVWDSRDSFLEYLCDPIIADGLNEHSKLYNKKHNIKSSISVGGN